MTEPTTLGSFLRHERERRGVALKAISEQTKVAVPLLEGLEADDLTRWPGGIFRRAFVRAYANAIGIDADDVVRRLEQQHPEVHEGVAVPGTAPHSDPTPEASPFPDVTQRLRSTRRVRFLGTAADLTVALVVGLASAAAGSRMLWPLLLIAGYYALGTLLTGGTPMVALLSDVTGREETNSPEVSSSSIAESRKNRLGSSPRESRLEGAVRGPHGRLAKSGSSRGVPS
jgi:hypothetical protein